MYTRLLNAVWNWNELMVRRSKTRSTRLIGFDSLDPFPTGSTHGKVVTLIR